MPRTTVAVIAALLSTIACAGHKSGAAPHPTATLRAAQQQARSVDPTGEYDLRFADDGGTRAATMTVQGQPGSYPGRSRAENRPEATITAVAASGPQVIVTADIPQGVLLVRLRVQGDSVHGDWSLKSDGGRVVGVHRRAEK
jgi:hypothetical protein